MEFLKSLKEAMSNGISKDEFMVIWNKEMELKCSNDTTLSKASEDVTAADTERADCTEKEDCVMSLLTKIVEQQNATHQQQIRIEHQLKDIQSSHNREQLKMQQQFDKMQDIISGKVLAFETTLANLQQSFAHCVRHYVHSESLDVQEKLLLITDTIYNKMFKEMENVLHGMAGDVSITTSRANIIRKKQVKNEGRLSNESAAEASTKTHLDNITGDNACIGEGKEKNNPLITGESGDSIVDASFIEISDLLKNTLCCELNTFLVSIQKLLLRPLNSEDISFYITDRMKELFQQERSITTDQLLNVQTAISCDIQARLYKIETCFKMELERTRSYFEHNEKLKHEFNKILEEMCKLKSFICFELSTRMMSNVEIASVSKMESPSGLGVREVSELGDNKVIRHDGTQELNEVSQLGSKMLGGGNYHPARNDKDWINLYPREVMCEQIQTMIFMLLMYMLTLLTYHDSLGGTNTSETSKNCAKSELQSSSDTSCELLESETAPEEPAKKTEFDHEFGAQINAVPKQLTDTHLKLMLGHHKEAQYLCYLNCSKLSQREECFQLNDIAPGYNLQLQVHITEENKNLNVYIMSISGEQDNSLTWPAEFSITIKLLDNIPLACLQTDKWQNFTKMKVLSRPNKSTGHSTPIPVCYFRESVINRVIDNDTLSFHISVQYIGDGKDKMQMLFM